MLARLRLAVLAMLLAVLEVLGEAEQVDLEEMEQMAAETQVQAQMELPVTGALLADPEQIPEVVVHVVGILHPRQVGQERAVLMAMDLHLATDQVFQHRQVDFLRLVFSQLPEPMVLVVAVAEEEVVPVEGPVLVSIVPEMMADEGVMVEMVVLREAVALAVAHPLELTFSE